MNRFESFKTSVERLARIRAQRKMNVEASTWETIQGSTPLQLIENKEVEGLFLAPPVVPINCDVPAAYNAPREASKFTHFHVRYCQ